MKSVLWETICQIPDKTTDERLLPEFMSEHTNTEDINNLKVAVRTAIEHFLTAEQRYVLHEYFWNQKTKSEIAEELGIGSSAVCKRIKSACDTIKKHAEYYMNVNKKIKIYAERDSA